MSVPDLSRMDDEERLLLASKVKKSYDINLPELAFYNSSPCAEHGLQKLGCRRCGLVPRRHQRIGATWLYIKKHALLSDPVGSGKTASVGLTLAMAKEAGELENGRKVVVVCRAAAVRQWVNELHRMLPRLNSVALVGSRAQRLAIYRSEWDIIVMSKEMILNDVEALDQFKLGALVIDDVDSLRNRKNRQAWAIKRHAGRSPRVILVTATPFHKRLWELHSVLEPVGGVLALGNEWRFRARYLQTQKVQVWTKAGKAKNITQITGVRNITELKERIEPLVMRRTIEEMDDIEMPATQLNTVYLDMHPEQRNRYEELRKGVLEIVRSGKVEEMKKVEALAKVVYGAMICAGLPALGEEDGPQASTKLDWVMEKLEDDFSEEKVIVFAHNRRTIEALQKRLEKVGIKQVTIWGQENNHQLRQERIDQFWDDDQTRVLIGSASIEQSINLHASRNLVLLDSILNPARTEQLIGRIRRQGSKHKMVYVHQLLCTDSQDEKIPELLAGEQAIIDAVWNEKNEIFEELSPLTLLSLILK